MHYGKTEDGAKWHMLVNNKPICCERFVVKDVRLEAPDDKDEVCGNCDLTLRVKGKEARKNAPKPDPKTVYKPRFRLE